MRTALPRRLRAAALLAALPAWLAVGGCQPAEVRAQKQAAIADQLAAQKAFPAAAVAMGRATRLDGNNTDLWLKLGHVSLQAGDFAAADQAFQRAAELQPDSVEALENLVMLALRAGMMDQAKRFMDPLLVLQPDDPAGLLTQGSIALHERRYGEAIATADRLMATAPDITEAYLLRARALTGAGRTGEGIALLEKRATAAPAEADARALLSLLLDLYRRTGDVAGVRGTALRLHRLLPADPSYAMESARAYHAQGRDDLADATIADLRRAHPGSVGIVRAIVAYRVATLPGPAARAAVAAMARGAPPGIVAAVAGALVDMGDAGQALALVGPLIGPAVDAGNVDAATASARALAALGRDGEARARIDRVLAFDSGNVPALVTRARFRLARRDLAGALTDAQLAWSSDDDSQDAALLIAQIYDAGGNAGLAQQSYARAVQAFPDNYPLLGRYLDWLVAAGRRDAAIDAVSSYARRHRANRVAWQRYAALCTAAGNACVEEARQGLAAGA